MDKVRTVVEVGGQQFKLTCEESEDYLKTLAQYVNKKIAEVQGSYPSLSSGNATLLAALNLADELFQIRADYDALDSRISELREMPRPAAAPVKRPFERQAAPTSK